MEKEKLSKLLNDEDFLKKILPMKTPEEVQAEFKKEGLELSIEEIEALGKAINAAAKKGKPLSEDELENVSGGMLDLLGVALLPVAIVSLPALPIYGVYWCGKKAVGGIKSGAKRVAGGVKEVAGGIKRGAKEFAGGIKRGAKKTFGRN